MNYLYNHYLWPSPRAVNVVRALCKRGKIVKRHSAPWNHFDALYALAAYARISTSQLLQISIVRYVWLIRMPWELRPLIPKYLLRYSSSHSALKAEFLIPYTFFY